MAEFIPYPFYSDSVPIDISFVFENEKPAGKHGFLKINGSDFEFEDGTKVRFWGTNLNGGANFPEFAYSEKLAKRLSALGINLIRLHQLDAEWNTPNIYSLTKGKRISSTRDFDSESMKRLDYMLYCMKKEGIYCYMDMITYRKFKSGDGVDCPELLGDAAKPYLIFDRKLIELQKEFAEKFWNHINEYTNIAYKDDPMFVMTEIVNEADLFMMHQDNFKVNIEPYVTEFRDLFNEWLCKSGIDYDAYSCNLDETDDVLLSFKRHLQEKYYLEMIECMRKTGVRIPITGTNWNCTPENVRTQLVTDFIDTHAYFYDWRWGEFEKNCMQKSITQEKSCYLAHAELMNTADRPLFISEWDVPWPNAYRAESPIYSAAVGDFLGWSGFAIHTYAYTTKLDNMKMLGKEVSSTQIGGTPYREGIFSTWNDPAKFGLFYHASLITRRGDVKKSQNSYAFLPQSRLAWDVDVVETSVEKSLIYATFDENIPGATYITKALNDDSLGEVTSDTGELYRSWSKNYGIVDTPMTKCAYGFLKKNGAIELSGMKIKCGNDYAVIAVSSLTGDEISKSDNMLLTTVGKAENSGFCMDGDRLVDYGKPPVLIEVIEAEIEIETEVPNLFVWAVNAEGVYIGKAPSSYENGIFKFTVGHTSQAMYYLIVAE